MPFQSLDHPVSGRTLFRAVCSLGTGCHACPAAIRGAQVSSASAATTIAHPAAIAAATPQNAPAKAAKNTRPLMPHLPSMVVGMLWAADVQNHLSRSVGCLHRRWYQSSTRSVTLNRKITPSAILATIWAMTSIIAALFVKGLTTLFERSSQSGSKCGVIARKADSHFFPTDLGTD